MDKLTANDRIVPIADILASQKLSFSVYACGVSQRLMEANLSVELGNTIRN